MKIQEKLISTVLGSLHRYVMTSPSLYLSVPFGGFLYSALSNWGSGGFSSQKVGSKHDGNS